MVPSACGTKRYRTSGATSTSPLAAGETLTLAGSKTSMRQKANLPDRTVAVAVATRACEGASAISVCEVDIVIAFPAGAYAYEWGAGFCARAVAELDLTAWAIRARPIAAAL